MRIAFPVDKESGLDSEIFDHFGHAPYYLIVDVSNGNIDNIEVIKNSYRESHGPGVVPKLLADHGVNVLICRGVGRKARGYFESLDIKVIRGAYGHVKEAVESYLEGLLESKDYKPKEKWMEYEGDEARGG